MWLSDKILENLHKSSESGRKSSGNPQTLEEIFHSYAHSCIIDYLFLSCFSNIKLHALAYEAKTKYFLANAQFPLPSTFHSRNWPFL